VVEGSESNNQVAKSYTVTGPNLTVTGMTVTPASGPPGSAANLVVTVKNIGSETASNFKLASWFDRSSAPSCSNPGSVTAPVASLVPMASLSFSYPFNYGTVFGTRYTRAFVDSGCVVAETSESNNLSSKSYVVTGPNLTITGMTVTPSVGVTGGSAVLTVTIKNIGSETASNFQLASWFVRSTTPVCGNVASVTDAIGALAVNASLTFNYNFTFPASVGTFTARALVDSACAVTETSETNNAASRSFGVTSGLAAPLSAPSPDNSGTPTD
jgi:subtilase family serine protease